MELAFNLAWFVIAVVSYALLAGHLASLQGEPGRCPRRWQCLVALSCALVILFPVISLTDDLHEIQAAVEEPSSPAFAVKKCVVMHSLSPINPSPQMPFIISFSSTDVRWLAFGNVACGQTTALQQGLHENSFGRAPPFFWVV